jgi:hypothetical protein
MTFADVSVWTENWHERTGRVPDGQEGESG